MPQMSPLMWGLLFLIFSSLLMCTMIKTYFTQNTKPLGLIEKTNYTKSFSLPWAW